MLAAAAHPTLGLVGKAVTVKPRRIYSNSNSPKCIRMCILSWVQNSLFFLGMPEEESKSYNSKQLAANVQCMFRNVFSIIVVQCIHVLINFNYPTPSSP